MKDKEFCFTVAILCVMFCVIGVFKLHRSTRKELLLYSDRINRLKDDVITSDQLRIVSALDNDKNLAEFKDAYLKELEKFDELFQRQDNRLNALEAAPSTKKKKK